MSDTIQVDSTSNFHYYPFQYWIVLLLRVKNKTNVHFLFIYLIFIMILIQVTPGRGDPKRRNDKTLVSELRLSVAASWSMVFFKYFKKFIGKPIAFSNIDIMHHIYISICRWPWNPIFSSISTYYFIYHSKPAKTMFLAVKRSVCRNMKNQSRAMGKLAHLHAFNRLVTKFALYEGT